MKLVAVTACPTGVAHTHLAAEALRLQAVVEGHEIAVETQGSAGVGDELTPEAIDAADAVIIAADIRVDPDRFRGKPVVAVSTARRDPQDGRRGQRRGGRGPVGQDDRAAASPSRRIC